MRIAVLDLGTNTFNLLIAEPEEDLIRSLYNERISVKLGRGGINKNIIAPEALDRGLAALYAHKQVIEYYKAEKVVAIGTSALRTAENSQEFISAVKNKLGFEIEIISGEREADLIYLGVRQTLDNLDGNFLMLDIGGGSNEFILANNEKMLCKESFKLGIARIIEQFQPSDPIKPEEILAMEKHFAKELMPFIKSIEHYQLDYLVGAEGAFETFYNVVNYIQKPGFHRVMSRVGKPLTYEDYHRLHEILIRSTATERMKMKGMEPYRVEMIVPAAVFIDFILKNLKIKHLVVSPYSLKEGVAWELFHKTKMANS